MPPSTLRLLAALAPFVIGACETDGVGPGAACDTANVDGLSVGEVAEFRGASARRICVLARSPGEEFVLIATSLTESRTTPVAIESSNVSRALGPPAPTPGPTDPPTPRGSGVAGPLLSHPGYANHGRLRQLEHTALTGRTYVPAAGLGGTELRNPGLAPPSGVPQLGDLLTFNTQSESACEDPVFATGRVEGISGRAIVVADTANPAGGFESSDYGQFAATFDTLVAPLAEQHFGPSTDIDGNGRVIIFFTKDVNGVSSEGDESVTAGFFFSRDLFPRESPGPPLGSCATSNEAELLYLLVPDPEGVVGDPIDLDDVQRFTNVSIAHEYQHLINASRRLLGGASPRPFEDAWLNEALSHVVEELLFYRATDLSPGMDIGFEDLDSDGVRALNDFQRLNFFRFLEFLGEPGRNSPFDPDVGLATRGAAWNLIRYMADRQGQGDPAFFRALVDSPSTGVENLSGVLGGLSIVFDWVGDWSVGLYADNRVPGVPMRFLDTSWNHFSLYDSAGIPAPYIMTSDLGRNRLVIRNLEGGGSGYFRFAAAEGELAQITVRSGSNAPPASLRATLLRTK